MDLSWVIAVVKGFRPAGQCSNKVVVRAKMPKAILYAFVTGMALAGYGEQDKGKVKADFYLQSFAHTYDHCTEGVTIINSFVSC